MREMTRYHFDLGNSTDGALGMCAVIVASSPERAVRKLQRKLAQLAADTDHELWAEGMEYISVYITPEHITVKDIDEPDIAGVTWPLP